MSCGGAEKCGRRVLMACCLAMPARAPGAGKLDVYVAAAGFQPDRILPICIDVGTNNKALRKDPVYIGLDRERLEVRVVTRQLTPPPFRPRRCPAPAPR